MRIRSALGLLTVGLLVSASIGVAGAAQTCGGRAVTIPGTGGDDRLRGTPKADVISGGDGQDFIDGRGGDDVVCGGAGGDELQGGTGNDLLYGDAGRDSLSGGDGNDEMRAGTGRFHFFNADAGDDELIGSTNNEDLLNLYGAPNGMSVDLAEGVATGSGTDRLTDIDHVWGTDFDDTLTGDGEPNSLAGRGGDDTIVSGGGGFLSGPTNHGPFGHADIMLGEAGNDTLTGGDGLDTVMFFDAPEAVTVDLAAGTATGEGEDSLTAIEGVVTSRVGDTVSGDDGDNYFALSGGSHTIAGRGGRDLLYLTYALGPDAQPLRTTIDVAAGTIAAQGDSTFGGIEDVWGTDGPDKIVGDGGDNLLKGRGGKDVLKGAAGDDSLNGGRGNDVGRGGIGTDTCIKIERSTGCELPAS